MSKIVFKSHQITARRGSNFNFKFCRSCEIISPIKKVGLINKTSGQMVHPSLHLVVLIEIRSFKNNIANF